MKGLLLKMSDCCCSSGDCDSPEAYWITDYMDTAAGGVPVIETTLDRRDILGSWKVRWALGRDDYIVEPGLYAAGNPGEESPVLVSANFKMSFDRLRSNLKGRDVWILVLDTKGINVWCAAGKGTFGTGEIIRRIEETDLKSVVTGRELILPQLGAPGVAGHEVRKSSGFKVIYGPVRAEDLGRFMDSGMKADRSMRKVTFPLPRRLALIPVEIAGTLKYAVPAAAVFFLLSLFTPEGLSPNSLLSRGPVNAGIFLSAYLTGLTAVPVLLPWIPARSFSGKGLWAGFVLVILLVILGPLRPERDGILFPAGWALMIPAVTAFLSMMFTGSSTYTSLSGVKKEMRFYFPLEIIMALTGFIFWTVSLFTRF